MSELSKDIDIVDASILDYIVGMCMSRSNKIDIKRIKEANNGPWTWIDLQSLMMDMPLLRINSKGAVSRRIAKLENEGFITTKKRRENGHIRLYIRLEQKMDKLSFFKSNRVSLPIDKEQQDIDSLLLTSNRDGGGPVDETEPIIYTSNTDNKTNVICTDGKNPSDATLENFSQTNDIFRSAPEFWNSDNAIRKMRDSSKPILKILAMFFFYKNYKFKNKEEFNRIRSRNIKYANELALVYSEEEISQTMRYIKKAMPGVDWSLSLVLKKIPWLRTNNFRPPRDVFRKNQFDHG